MSDSIKKQIGARILANLGALIQPGDLRAVERKSDLLAQMSVMPALHVIVNGEVMTNPEEDNRGYTMQFHVDLKIGVKDFRDRAEVLDDLVAKVQVIMEGDVQLGGLANWIRYLGDEPFINEIDKPIGGTIVTYLGEYRRLRGNPSGAY